MSLITARQLVTITLNAVYSKIARFYDASVPNTLITEADKVSQWKDRSVYQQNANQPNTDNQPIYSSANQSLELGGGKFLNFPIPSDFNGYIYIANKNEGIIRVRLNVPSLSSQSRAYIQANGLSFGGYEGSPIVGIVFYAEPTIILQDEAIIINYLKLTGGSRGSWRTISNVSGRFRSDQPSNKLFEFIPEIPKQENAILNLSGVTIAEYLFYGMKSITELPADLNFSNAVNIAYLVGETLLTQFPLYNTAKVANFEGAWYNCFLLSTFPLLNTSSGTNFSYSWQNCTALYANQPWAAKLSFAEAVQLSATWSNNRFTSFPDYSTGSDYANNFSKVTSFLNTWSNNPNLNNFKKINTISGQNFDNTWLQCVALSNIEPLDLRNAIKFSSTWNNTALTAESVDNALISLAAGLANNPNKNIHFPVNTLIGNNNQKPTITNRRATNNWEAWEPALRDFASTGYNFLSGISGLQAKQWMISEFGVDVQTEQPNLDAVSSIINTVFSLDDLTKIISGTQRKLVISQESIELGSTSIWMYTDSNTSYTLPKGFRPSFSGATNLVVQIDSDTTLNAATVYTVTAITANSITLNRTSGTGTTIPANSRIYFGSTSQWLNTTVALTVNAGATIALNANTTISTTPPAINDTGYLPQLINIKRSQFTIEDIALRENTVPINGTIGQWNPQTGNIIANQPTITNQPILTTNTSANYVVDFNNKTFTFTFNNNLNNGRLYIGTTRNSILEFNLINQVNGNTFSFGIGENIPITGLIFINTQTPTSEQELIIRTYLVSRGANPLTQFDANNPTEFAGRTDFTERFKGDNNSLYSKIINFPGINTAAGTNFQGAWQNATSLATFVLVPNTAAGTNFESAWKGCTALVTFPGFNTTAGTNFKSAWEGCTALAIFNPVPNTGAGTNFESAWKGCTALVTFPGFNTAAGVNFKSAWQDATALTTFTSVPNTATGTNFESAWQGCTALVTFPVFNTASGTNFKSAWQGCTALVAFPLINTIAGIDFESAWQGCTALATFAAINTAAGVNFKSAWQNCVALVTFPVINTGSAVSLESAWQNCTVLTTFPAINTTLATNINNAWNSAALAVESIDNILISIAAGLANNLNKAMVLPVGTLTGGNNKTPESINRRGSNNWQSWEVALSQITDAGYNFSGGISGLQARQWVLGRFGVNVPIQEPSLTTVSSIIHTVFTLDDLTKVVSSTPQRKLIISQDSIAANATTIWLYTDSTTAYTLPQGFRPSFSGATSLTIQIANSTTINAATIYRVTGVSANSITISRISGTGTTIPANSRIYFGSTSKWLNTTVDIVVNTGTTVTLNANTTVSSLVPNVNDEGYLPQLINIKYPQIALTGIALRENIIPVSGSISQWNPQTGTSITASQNNASNQPSLTTSFSTNYVIDFNDKTLTFTFNNSLTSGKVYIGTSLNSILDFNLSSQSNSNTFTFGFGENVPIAGMIFINIQNPTQEQESVIRNYLIARGANPLSQFDANNPTEFASRTNFTERFTGANNSLYSKISTFPSVNTAAGTNFQSTWQGCTALTTFTSVPNTAAGTNFQSTWQDCNALVVFPAFNTSLGTNFQSTWQGCTVLTTFSTVPNTASGTNFESAWQDCTALVTFPAFNTAAGTNLKSAWQGCSSLTTFTTTPNTASATNLQSAWQGCTALVTFPLFNTSAATNLQSAWQGCTALTIFPAINTGLAVNLESAWRNCTALTTFPSINIAVATNLRSTWQGCVSLSSFPAINTISVNILENTWANCNLSQESIDNALISIAAGIANNPTKIVSFPVSTLTGGTNKTPTTVNRRSANNWETWETALKNVTDIGYNFSSGVSGIQARQWMLSGYGIDIPVEKPGLSSISSIVYGALALDDLAKITTSTAQRKLVISQGSITIGSTSIWLYTDSTVAYTLPQGFRPEFSGATNLVIQIANGTIINAATVYTVTAITENSITLSRTSGTGTTIPANSRIYFGNSPDKWLNTTVDIVVDAGATITFDANITVSTTPPTVNDTGYLPQLINIKYAQATVNEIALRENIIPVSANIGQWSPENGTNIIANQNTAQDQPILSTNTSSNYVIAFNNKTFTFTFNTALNNGKIYIGTIENSVLEFNLASQSSGSTFSFGVRENVPINAIVIINTQSPTSEQESIIGNYLAFRGANPLGQFDANNPTEFSSRTDFSERFAGVNNSLYSKVSTFPPVNTAIGTNFQSAWQGCSSLVTFPAFNTTAGTNFRSTWQDCTALTTFSSVPNTAAGTNFQSTWQGCSSLVTFPAFSTVSGTNFESAWRNCSSLTTFTAIPNTSLATSFQSTWQGCTALVAFPAFNTAAGTNFQSAWQGCSSLTTFNPVPNTSLATNFQSTWQGCSSLVTFPTFNTAAATNFQSAWQGCTALANLPPINTIVGTNFNQSLKDCPALTQESVDNVLISIAAGMANNTTKAISFTDLLDQDKALTALNRRVDSNPSAGQLLWQSWEVALKNVTDIGYNFSGGVSGLQAKLWMLFRFGIDIPIQEISLDVISNIVYAAFTLNDLSKITTSTAQRKLVISQESIAIGSTNIWLYTDSNTSYTLPQGFRPEFIRGGSSTLVIQIANNTTLNAATVYTVTAIAANSITLSRSSGTGTTIPANSRIYFGNSPDKWLNTTVAITVNAGATITLNTNTTISTTPPIVNDIGYLPQLVAIQSIPVAVSNLALRENIVPISSSVSQWNPQTGSNMVATQATIVNQPILTTSNNGNYALDFNGKTLTLTFNTALNGGRAYIGTTLNSILEFNLANQASSNTFSFGLNENIPITGIILINTQSPTSEQESIIRNYLIGRGSNPISQFDTSNPTEFASKNNFSSRFIGTGNSFYSRIISFPVINTIAASNLQSAWQNCNALISFPFINTSAATNFQSTWQSCTALTSFPPINLIAAINLQETWNNCNLTQESVDNALISIAAGLANNRTKLISGGNVLTGGTNQTPTITNRRVAANPATGQRVWESWEQANQSGSNISLRYITDNGYNFSDGVSGLQARQWMLFKFGINIPVQEPSLNSISSIIHAAFTLDDLNKVFVSSALPRLVVSQDSIPAGSSSIWVYANNSTDYILPQGFRPEFATPVVTTQLVGSTYSNLSKYAGITLASNGRLYCAPSSSTQVLEITPLPEGGATTQLVGSTLSSSSYGEIALAPNGRLYCAPHNSAQVLEITPLPGGGATTQLVGSTYSNVSKYNGIALASNGRLYCSPHAATQVLEITPLPGGGATTQLIGSTYIGAGQYLGIALAPNGRLYCAPTNSTQVLEITPLPGGGATTQLVGSTYIGTGKYLGIALAPNGRLYCAPRNAAQVLEITPLPGGGATTQLVGSTYIGTDKYFGIALASNGRLYCAPTNSTQVLEITPLPGGGATTQLVGSTYSDVSKYYGIALAPNGRLYCAPSSSTKVLEVNVGAPSNWVNSNTEILLNASL